MAQMAPALAEAAGSPSPNADLPSSTVQTPLRPSDIGEASRDDSSRLHVNCASLNHNGICRSLTNSKTTTDTVSCVMEKVHRSNKFSYTAQKSVDSAISKQPNHQNPSSQLLEAKSNEKAKIYPSSQNETVDSTPTRMPTTTTKTCAPKLLQNLSSCDVSLERAGENMKERHSVAQVESSSQALLDQKVAKIGCNQTRLAARARKLEARLRTLQTRQLESHVGEQASSAFVKRQKNRAARLHQSHETPNSKTIVNFHRPASGVVKEEESREKRQLIKSVARVDDEPHFNRSSQYKNKHVGQIENGVSDEYNCGSNGGVKCESDVARSLVCQLELVEDVADSDATLSSSGGESCDEMNDCDRPKAEIKRSSTCSSQFYSDRGSIASRWAWLRSQIIDIERRIRRCDETYKNIRVGKRPVQLEKQNHVVDKRTVASVANKSADDLLVDTVNVLNNVKEPLNLNNSLKTDITKPDISTSRNSNNFLTEGYHKGTSVLHNSKSNLHLSTESITFCTAARTRPLHSWQKRKLFSLSQLQKPTPSVLCSCSSPLTPCVLCQKNSKNLIQFKPRQDVRERVSLVDLSFHSVLSFETEIPLSLHFGALLKKGNFQSKIFKLSPPKTTKIATKRKYVRSVSSPAAIKKARKDSLEVQYRKQGLRALQNRKKPVSLPNTPKNERTSKPRLCKSEVANKKRPAAVNAGLRLASQLQKRARSLSLPSASNSRPSSPVSCSASPTFLGQSFPGSSLSAKRKKPTSNAFDINNIVIPYSMASTTRVERLQYKEILTPAWRELVVPPQEQPTTDGKEEEDDEEIEDLSNLTFALRHMKCEEQERKRFLGMAIKKKKRAARQSSEATTPEPVSPGSLLLDGALSAGQPSSGVPSPNSSNPPSLNSSLNVTSPTGLAGALPVVNMLPQDSMLAKLDQSGKSSKHGSRRTSSVDNSEREDSNEAWPVVAPWPLRTFPLNENDQEELKNTPLSPSPPVVPPSPCSSTSRTNSPILSPVDSPDGTGHASWTVKVLSPEAVDNLESDSKPPRKGIVLKLAKR